MTLHTLHTIWTYWPEDDAIELHGAVDNNVWDVTPELYEEMRDALRAVARQERSALV
jgi:hypothetical protein